MNKQLSLRELKEKDIRRIKNRPAIGGFKDDLSLGFILESAYISPKFYPRKHVKGARRIEDIQNEYRNCNVLFLGVGGVGKTTSFLRLYVNDDEEHTTGESFYYIYAPELVVSKNNLNAYQKRIREIVEKGEELDGILLLDGLEEAFQDDFFEAVNWIDRLEKSSITFWVSCRLSFYELIKDEAYAVFDEIIEVNMWDWKEVNQFVENALKENDNKVVVADRFNRFKDKTESLCTRPLFTTMILFLAMNGDIDDIDNEYELIEVFLDKWYERENEEKNLTYEKEESYKRIREVALEIYKYGRSDYTNSLEPFKEFLITTTNKKRVRRFYHREFLIYFIVNAMVHAILYNPDDIVLWFSQTFYDEITNMAKPVFVNLSREDSKVAYDNLFSVYKETYENVHRFESFFETENQQLEEALLRIRDEIIYFTLMLRNVDYESFAKYVNEHNPGEMLSMALAYGMANINPNNKYTQDFAMKLTPETPEEIRNRGWGMCFFGDVNEDGYKYEDSEKKDWSKVRENRLRRLSDNSYKYKTRMLDLPLLYCFYYSRDFKDCTSFSDYCIIRDTNVSMDVFKSDLISFMEEQKERLLKAYSTNLLLAELRTNTFFLNAVCNNERFFMNENEIIVKIDQDLAKRIYKDIEEKEIIRNNVLEFWNDNGSRIIDGFREKLKVPQHKNINKDEFDRKIAPCKVIIMSANSVEGRVISWRLMEELDNEELFAYAKNGYLFQFATIKSVPVVHIWPTEMSSFTRYGSFNAIKLALKLCKPQFVFSVGVAFGIDPEEQALGDVIIAKNIVCYDNYNKVTDGNYVLRNEDVFSIVDESISGNTHMYDVNVPPKEVGDFKWFFNSVLTGGTVVSDIETKRELVTAAENIGCNIVGGEMEAAGIYFACKNEEKNAKKDEEEPIKFMLFKGICDWGAEKNCWKSLELEVKDDDSNGVKDYIQAFACNNAYNAMKYSLEQWYESD